MIDILLSYNAVLLNYKDWWLHYNDKTNASLEEQSFQMVINAFLSLYFSENEKLLSPTLAEHCRRLAELQEEERPDHFQEKSFGCVQHSIEAL